MSLKGLFSILGDHPEYRRHLAEVADPEKTPELVVREGAKPCYVGGLWHHRKVPVLVLTPRPEDARRLHDQLLTYLGDREPIYLLPEPEVLPYERLAVDANTVNQRLAALAALASASTASGDAGVLPPLVVASIGGALPKTLPPGILAGAYAGAEAGGTLRVGQRVRLNRLLTEWVDLGYRNEPVVEAPGSFSRRGGIIDVYPPQADLPFRIELLDNQVDTIRRFDPFSQRSVESVDHLKIVPAREQLPSLAHRERIQQLIAGMDFAHCHRDVRERMEEELGTLFTTPNLEALPFYNGLVNDASLLEYLSAPGLIVLDRSSQIEAAAQEMEDRFAQMRANREERGELPRHFPAPYLSWAEVAGELQRRPRVQLQSWVREDGDPIFRSAPPYYGRLEELATDIRRPDRVGEGRTIVAVTQHARRLAEILEEAGTGVAVSPGLDESPQAGGVYLVAGSLREGWTLDNGATSLTLLTDAELFGTVKESRRGRDYRQPRVERGREVVLSELVPGNYVVHVDHGVARFAGTTRMGEAGEEKEYLVLEYADNDRLYVPTDHLNRVAAYVGAHDQTPTLTRLGTAEWARIKERVKGSTRELARDLLQLYAARQVAQGHQFGPDTVWQQELEDSFPYEETPDQARTIDEVKTDMERLRPMDRLVCGDVGYGKTEVALRAAFKTVAEGMQVGILVPTTVLAQQHYATFGERLTPFPVRVEVLSRFRPKREQRAVVEDLQRGSVDIVIGTHRLLQKDVHFKNLGLVVVDEEQRFGVAHKERLKQLRREVEVLTLSATPIPRTLHMALSGIRDMSVMDTPPEARLPVKTFVAEYSDEVVKEAVLREMERGGQVFFLHNRVKTSHQTAAKLAELVPQARILVGHGRMPEEELEEAMLVFARGEADVLVCTTIIESGLDMPNVNTLIVDRADRFGLSQLYQLRGRVGRGDRRAYAYLLVPRGRRLTPAAEQRLQAILEASELGSGFRIAMRDLEIRGAGNLLGAAQSGNIHAVGLDLYSQLMQEAVWELNEPHPLAPSPSEMERGEGVRPTAAPPAPELARVELPLSAYIPESYIDHLPTRLEVYQRLARLRERREVPGVREELHDRFGALPQEVENLLRIVDLRALAQSVGIESIVHSSDAIVLVFQEPVGGARVPLQRALGPSVSIGNRQMQLPTRPLGDRWLSRLTLVLERLQGFQEKLGSLAVAAAAPQRR